MITNYYSRYNLKLHYRLLLNRLLIPFKRKGAQLSVIEPANENQGDVSKLLSISLDASRIALSADLSNVSEREKPGSEGVNIYPGEHYKFLYGLMQVLKPKIVVELGTYLGQASLAIKAGLPEGSQLHTFDVIKWNEFRDTCLRSEDFDGSFFQHVDDLTDYNNILKHQELLKQADFIFVDALKDGKQELLFLENFRKIGLKNGCILMFDDIRVWNMINIWRNISLPKIDITSLGHWSGTGLVEWKA